MLVAIETLFGERAEYGPLNLIGSLTEQRKMVDEVD